MMNLLTPMRDCGIEFHQFAYSIFKMVSITRADICDSLLVVGAAHAMRGRDRQRVSHKIIAPTYRGIYVQLQVKATPMPIGGIAFLSARFWLDCESGLIPA